MFLLSLPLLPLKLAFGLIRLFGLSRVAFLVIGVLIGLFCAPTTGREMRERVRDRLEAGTAAGGADPTLT